MAEIMMAAMTVLMMVISVSSEAAVEELRRLLLLLLGCAVQVITHACTRTCRVPRLSWWSSRPGYTKVPGCSVLHVEVSLGNMLNSRLCPRHVNGYYYSLISKKVILHHANVSERVHV